MDGLVESIHIKHMVCPRCVTTVESIVDRLGLRAETVSLGEVKLQRKLTDAEFRSFAEMLEASGFEVLVSREKRLINKIKSSILERIHYADISSPLKLSAHLAESLGYEYSYLSKVFSAVEAVTIERYSMLQRIERAKELLSYGELNVTEISELLDFSSAAHFSAQFKRETGMSPSQFKKSDRPARRSLDSF
ncbi:AraC family transcriptional regulator [Pelagicoccus enzymogenes]|uniref:helix-turn-helix domain-containing protein n=1 Tax=Pelagicoccus enzymogenes TaxID=2773457 RepID=UPI00280D3616|nr:AraC family transcriptional regulator [Pelagicoccus enzymogenes]MDQ8198203.1 AraC family transcriptional regulator [Pelagicoccus enzymogenes]